MNLPFSITDILERIVPGAALLSLLLLDNFETLPELDLDLKVVATAAFIATSYIAGVMVNIYSGFFRFLSNRYIDSITNRKPMVADAYKDVFSTEFSGDAWRFCYGVVMKEKFGVNTSFFAGIEVFCSSMFVVFLLGLFVTVVRYLDGSMPLGFPTMFFVLAVIFCLGSRKYSRAFSESIYDAFYSWYCFERPGSGPSAEPPV